MPFKHISETHVNLIESGLISSKFWSSFVTFLDFVYPISQRLRRNLTRLKITTFFRLF